MYNFQIRVTGKVMIKHEGKRKKFQLEGGVFGRGKRFYDSPPFTTTPPSPKSQSWEHEDVTVTWRKPFLEDLYSTSPTLPALQQLHFFSSAAYVPPPSTVQYSLSSPLTQCPSTALVTPSHFPAFLLQHLQSPKVLQLFPTSFMD